MISVLWVKARAWAVTPPLRDAAMVVQFNITAFFSVRTWPWMMLFYKLRPLLRSAQVEKELATLKEEFNTLKEAFDRSAPDCTIDMFRK